mgnify:CR=1 FL=1
MSELTRGQFVGLPHIHQQLAQSAGETVSIEPEPSVQEDDDDDDDDFEDITEQVCTWKTECCFCLYCIVSRR